jgi:hypothetical protein
VSADYWDSGSSLGLWLEFSPTVPIPSKENAEVIVFVHLQNSIQTEIAIGPSRPTRPPSYPLDAIQDWQIEVTFDERLTLLGTLKRD